MAEGWGDALRRFALAPRALLEGREMQRRAESKFVMPVSAAADLLPALEGDYALLAAGPALVATYRSLYFDTADLELFHAHRRGRRIRHKVRIRHYPDRRVSFLEVKTRLSDEEATKTRRPRAYGDSVLSAGDAAFVSAHSGVRRALFPQAWTDFRRITLLGIRTHERVTIDLDLSVRMGKRRECLGEVAIVEIKQSRRDRSTAAMVALRRAGWREGWASKYCLGIVLTRPEVRANRLLDGLRALRAAAWAS